MVLPVSRPHLIQQLGLGGLIHIWGAAGTGKTLLACKIASEESKTGKVEWVNTDAKQSFIPYLKRLVESGDGILDNIVVTMVSDRSTIRNLILNLRDSLDRDVKLIVIDSITRVLDMARHDHTLWGRELIEEALPTLAGVVKSLGVNIIITSETRNVENSGTIAVHHRAITQWSDHDICLVKDDVKDSSKLFNGAELESQIGIFNFSNNSLTVLSTREEAEVGS